MNIYASNVVSSVTALIVRPATELATQVVAHQSDENMETNHSEYVRDLWSRFCDAGPNEMMTSMQAAFCDDIEGRDNNPEGLPIVLTAAAVIGVGIIGVKLVSALRNYLSSQE